MARSNYRTDFIINNLSVNGFVSIKELSKRLKVSEMTIRRDLR